MVLKDLTPAEIAWLLRFHDLFDRKLNLNMSEEELIHKFKTHLRGDARTMIQRLRTKGYFYYHGGRRTYYISSEGADKAEEYKKQLSPQSANKP